jgi:hypothetical protein
MPRNKFEPTETVDEIVAQAVKAKDGNERRRIAAKARSLGPELIKKPQGKGRPTKYSKAMADRIIGMVAEGRTLTKISTELGLALQDVYTWLNDYPGFLENYQKARRLMCVSLIDNMLDQAESTEKDEALLLKVKSGIYQWVASKYNSEQFSDKRTVQVNGSLEHRHSHELATDQKRRIAESWLISQQEPESPLIEATTTGPNVPGVSVQLDEPPELPKKKKVVATKKPASAGAHR